MTHLPGISNIVMTGWVLHLYWNIVSLVENTHVDSACLMEEDENDVIRAFEKCLQCCL